MVAPLTELDGRARLGCIPEPQRVADAARQLDRLVSETERLVVIASVHELLSKVCVCVCPSDLVSDPVELLHGSAIGRNRLIQVSAFELHHSQVDQGGSDLFGASHLLGEAKAAPQYLRGLIELPHAVVNTADNARRGGEAFEILVLLEDGARVDRVGQGGVEVAYL